MPRTGGESLSFLECGREQVGGRQTAVRPPFLGDRQNLFLRGQVIEAVGRADSLAKGKVTWQDYILSADRDDQGTLRRPRPYPWYLGE
jgi:hypothetical protein